MMILHSLIKKRCKRKNQLHKGALKWSKAKESHRKQRHKRKIMGKAKSRIITNNRDSIRLASWNIRGIQEKPKSIEKSPLGTASIALRRETHYNTRFTRKNNFS